jgi:hypothetical protein
VNLESGISHLCCRCRTDQSSTATRRRAAALRKTTVDLRRPFPVFAILNCGLLRLRQPAAKAGLALSTAFRIELPHRKNDMKTRRSQSHSTKPLLQAKRAVTVGIRKVADSPWAKFTTGVVLLTSGLDEAIDTLFADLSALELGAHHGVILLGFVNVLSSLPDMLDGLVGTFLVDEHEEDTAAAPSPNVPQASPPSADATEHLRRAA